MAKKPWTAIPLLVCLVAPVWAQQSNQFLPPPDQDAFVGKWQAVRERSQPTLDDVDASYWRTMSRDGDDRLVSSGHISRSGKPTQHSYRIRCDGNFHPVPDGSMACTYQAANLVEGESRSHGGHDYWMEQVSQDGQTITISGYKDKQRTKIVSLFVLGRVK